MGFVPFARAIYFCQKATYGLLEAAGAAGLMREEASMFFFLPGLGEMHGFALSGGFGLEF